MARRIKGHEDIGGVAYRKREAEQAFAEGGIEWEVEWRRVGAGKDGSADIRAFQAEVLDGHLRTHRSLLTEKPSTNATSATTRTATLDWARAAREDGSRHCKPLFWR